MVNQQQWAFVLYLSDSPCSVTSATVMKRTTTVTIRIRQVTATWGYSTHGSSDSEIEFPSLEVTLHMVHLTQRSSFRHLRLLDTWFIWLRDQVTVTWGYSTHGSSDSEIQLPSLEVTRHMVHLTQRSSYRHWRLLDTRYSTHGSSNSEISQQLDSRMLYNMSIIFDMYGKKWHILYTVVSICKKKISVPLK